MSVGDCSDGVSVAAATKLFVTRRGELTPQDLTHDAHHLIVTFIYVSVSALGSNSRQRVRNLHKAGCSHVAQHGHALTLVFQGFFAPAPPLLKTVASKNFSFCDFRVLAEFHTGENAPFHETFVAHL